MISNISDTANDINSPQLADMKTIRLEDKHRRRCQ